MKYFCSPSTLLNKETIEMGINASSGIEVFLNKGYHEHSHHSYMVKDVEFFNPLKEWFCLIIDQLKR